MTFKSLVVCTALMLPFAMRAQNPSSSRQQPQHSSSTRQQPQKQNGSGKHAEKKHSEELSQSDKIFLKAIIQEDISEIKLGKMALQKSSSEQVKDYARTKILAADPEMRDRAEQIARDHGMQPPTSPNARQKKMHLQLSQKSGRLFDNAYLTYEAGQQTGEVKLLKAEAGSTKSSTMKDYLAKEKAPVEDAAAAARKISAKIASSMTHYHQHAIDKPTWGAHP